MRQTIRNFFNEYKFPLISFLTWRILLFAFLFLAIKFVPLQKDFLGGGVENYLEAPWFWAWANFDGEHYLSIARYGYKSLQFFFFPLYPILIKFVAHLFGDNFFDYLISGLVVSNISFFISLVGLWKLARLDFDYKTILFSLLTLLVFPTSFYFGSVYTESLFFSLVVWTFYFARKKRWLLTGILGALSSGTRIVGLALIPALFAEGFWQKKRDKKSVGFLMAPLITLLGLGAYEYYLKIVTGDPLIFMRNLEIFGEHRTSKLILLPQVFYRYIFKIIPSLDFSYFPGTFVVMLEFWIAFVFLFLIVACFFKTRLSYAIYSIIGFLIPTLSGSFSSMPRYVLVLFPAFFVVGLYISRLRKSFQVLFFLVLLSLLMISTSLFTRGIWIG